MQLSFNDKKNCLKIFNSLNRYPFTEYFYDINKFCSIYDQNMIKLDHIDLSIIKKKLDSGGYKDIKEFKEDFLKLFGNFDKFKEVDSNVYNIYLEFKKTFDSLVLLIFDDKEHVKHKKCINSILYNALEPNEYNDVLDNLHISPAPYVEIEDNVVVEKQKYISANLPVEQQEMYLLESVQSKARQVTMLDAVWKSKHVQKFVKNKSKNKNIRDIPWEDDNEPKEVVPISERRAFFQRNTKRTWFTTIGDKIVEDHGIWMGVRRTRDYLGRSWVLAPIKIINNYNHNHECYLPKARIHRYDYHESSVTSIDFFPKYGHFFMSSSLDHTLKIWDVSNDRQCLQIYSGHTHGIVDVKFNHDGLKFASICYGKQIKLWDTESGKRESGSVLRDVPSQIIMPSRPEYDKQIMTTLANGYIAHYDFRVGPSLAPVLEYVYHTRRAIGITFVQDKYFMTTSEDKSICLWEIGQSKPVSVLKEDWLTPISSLFTHPKENSVAAQLTQRAEILVINIDNELSIDSNKSFVGCQTDSYPSKLTISPDGKFITQGDINGRIYIWNWASAKLPLPPFKACDGVISKSIWSPNDPSQIVCSSYDNTIALLE